MRKLLVGFLAFLATTVAGQELKINDGGTWRLPTSIEINDGGTWRTIQQIEINDGGTWRTVYTAVVITVTNDFPTAAASEPSDANICWELQNDGDIVQTVNFSPSDTGDWIAPKGTESSYDVEAHVDSGSTPTGSPFDTRLVLSTTRQWCLAQTVPGSNGSVFSITVRRVSDSTTMDTATITMEATVDP